MGSVTQSFLKLFRGSSGEKQEKPRLPRAARRSSGVTEFMRAIAGREGLCILDIGPTSASNIQRLTELGHKVYSEDVLLASKEPALVTNDEDGKLAYDEKRFLDESLSYPPHTFDAVLCWDIADFMDEPLVKPVVGRIWSVLKPGGLVLAFFHTKDAGPDATCYRYHMSGNDSVEMQPLTVSPNGKSRDRRPAYRLQRVFNNRHIENLFRDFSSIKFFLARDCVREVLITR